MNRIVTLTQTRPMMNTAFLDKKRKTEHDNYESWTRNRSSSCGVLIVTWTAHCRGRTSARIVQKILFSLRASRADYTTTNSTAMKRKLDVNDVPTPATEVEATKDDNSFAALGLDSRLLQGIAKQKFQNPTPVQSKAIPLALEGRDILARAKTGTGKTAAYLLPILHLILKRKLVRLELVWRENIANANRHPPRHAHPR